MAKRALIYGITGQDGWYLSRLLLEKDYAVAGAAQQEASVPGVGKIYTADLAGKESDYLFPITDFSPDEVYNLAGMSSPLLAEANPALAMKVNAAAPAAMLKLIAESGCKARFFQASTSYMFSGQQKVNENTAPSPLGEYGRTKLQAHLSAAAFRKKGVHASCGILFNHESPRRGENFVTRKISLGVAKIKAGLETSLMLGNLEAKRDWGFAGDYVEAMWLMLQQDKPDDYVIATGVQHSVRDFCKEAFSHAGLDYEKYVKTDPSLVRKAEAHATADTTKAREKLCWKPATSFKQLAHMMVDEDIRSLKEGGMA